MIPDLLTMKRVAEGGVSGRTRRLCWRDGDRNAHEIDRCVDLIYDWRNAPLSYERLVLPWLLFDASQALLPELRTAIRELWILTAQRCLAFHARDGDYVFSHSTTINLYEPIVWLCRGFYPYRGWSLLYSRIDTNDGVVVKARRYDPRDDRVTEIAALNAEARALRYSLFDLGLDPVSLTLFFEAQRVL